MGFEGVVEGAAKGTGEVALGSLLYISLRFDGRTMRATYEFSVDIVWRRGYNWCLDENEGGHMNFDWCRKDLYQSL